MLKLCTFIKIGDIELDFCNEISVETSFEKLTDTAEITIPRKLNWQGKPVAAGSNALFKKGNKVLIRCGYDYRYHTIFEGYVSFVSPNLPVQIKCEDNQWLFKQFTFTKSYTSVTLQTLLKEVLAKGNASFPALAAAGITIDKTFDQSLGKFTSNFATGAQVFEELKKTYGIYTFFRGNVLYSGLAYYPNSRTDVIFRFGSNIINGDGLVYSNKDDVKVKVKAISINGKNEKQEVDFGDPDGEQRTIHVYNVPLADLKVTAQRELDRLKTDGFSGSFETFFEPFVTHGDGAVLQDDKLPDRNGTYLIKSVNYQFGFGGGRQTIALRGRIQ